MRGVPPDGLNHYWQAVERQSILTVTQVHPESLRMLSHPGELGLPGRYF